MTRADLSPGGRAVQAAHAALKFAATYPEQFTSWITGDQILVVLETADEPQLYQLWIDVIDHGLRVVEFQEPDLDWDLTALAIEPAGWSLVKHLPLALKGGES